MPDWRLVNCALPSLFVVSVWPLRRTRALAIFLPVSASTSCMVSVYAGCSETYAFALIVSTGLLSPSSAFALPSTRMVYVPSSVAVKLNVCRDGLVLSAFAVRTLLTSMTLLPLGDVTRYLTLVSAGVSW